MPRRFLTILIEFSIPLLLGVVAALIAANTVNEAYEHLLHAPWSSIRIFGHALTLHYVANEIFMVFFFGIAVKEITESVLPGGSLNPPRKALNPLMATLGGVAGPVAVFFAGLWLCFEMGIYAEGDWALVSRGWGIPTATDIALAWLCARFVFGKGHPAVDFLLLLAIADDAIGLVIIAVFYGDPTMPVHPGFLGLIAVAMAVAFALRKFGVRNFWAYIALAGPIAWSGLTLANLHPALALCFVVPFMPAPRRDTGLFRAEDEVERMGEELASDLKVESSTLHDFEHSLKVPVDLGLFLFAFTQAGVPFAHVGPMSWLIFGSLLAGKVVGISLMGLLAVKLGAPLPNGMTVRDLLMASLIAAVGLTVALFISTAAFSEPDLRGQAKMGALFSSFVGVAAILLGRALSMNNKSSG
ncbi:MAG: Na+/H+ antiporter NhaA [Myxococcota bacterium]|nr:Na+/H+ antiporter NhaA [Myxococcota bacterium]